MLVRMKTRIGGYRNGEPWPAPGGTIDVPAHEAHGLIANGYASLVPGELVEGELIDAATGDVLATGADLELTGDGTPLPAADPDNDEQEQADDWSFGDTPGDGDDEAAEDSDDEAAEDSDEEAAADEVTGDASPTVPTGARKPKRR